MQAMLSKKALFNLGVFAAALTLVGIAQAGTTGPEFQTLFNTITNWVGGFLGRALALAAFLFGSGVAIAKQDAIPAIFGVVVALILSVGPTVINTMLAATF